MKQKKNSDKKKNKQSDPLKRSSLVKKTKKNKRDNNTIFMKKINNSEDPIKIQNKVFENEDEIKAEINVNQELVKSEDNFEDDYFDDYDEDKCGIEKVQIFGTDGKHILPILTDSEGRLKISADIIVIPISYKEIVIKNITTTNNFKFTQAFDISKNINTSFIIYNHSLVNFVTIQLQDSPDDGDYQIDLPEMIIEPKSFKILTPTRFVRYQRVAYRSTNLNNPAEIDVFYQAQSYINN